MITHIVLWKFRLTAEGASRDENITRARSLLGALPAQIPGIRRFETGKNIVRSAQAYDLALYAEFIDRAHLEMYQNHPAHLAVVEWLRRVHQGRVVVDYENGT